MIFLMQFKGKCITRNPLGRVYSFRKIMWLWLASLDKVFHKWWDNKWIMWTCFLSDNTPRKSSRTPSKLSLLQNTPDRNDQSFTEIERHTPRPFRSRKSQEVETDLRTHDLPVETNNNSLLNSSTVMNNSRFDPQHLYGEY